MDSSSRKSREIYNFLSYQSVLDDELYFHYLTREWTEDMHYIPQFELLTKIKDFIYRKWNI